MESLLAILFREATLRRRSIAFSSPLTPFQGSLTIVGASACSRQTTSRTLVLELIGLFNASAFTGTDRGLLRSVLGP